jgi:hypothetical protein
MLQVPDRTKSPETQDEPSIRVFTGRELTLHLHRLGPAGRGLLASDLIAGRAIVENLTARQARDLTHACFSYVRAARLLSPLQRSRVRCGILPLASVARHRKPVTDSDLDKLITEVGADRVFAALDRITTPAVAA